jgi:Skp family chaperone for outer membrane proteins
VAVFDAAKLFSTSVYVQKKGAGFQSKLGSAQSAAAKKNQAFQEKWKKEMKKLQTLQGSLSEKDLKKKQDDLNKKYQKELKELQQENVASENKIKSAYQAIMMGIHKHVKSIIALLVEKRSQTSRPIHIVLSTEERVLWYYDTSTVIDLTDDIIERLDKIPLDDGDVEEKSKASDASKD